MDESEFEGTLVLERLAEIGKIDEFMEAIDADDYAQARALMVRANIEPQTIAIVLKKMSDTDGVD